VYALKSDARADAPPQPGRRKNSLGDVLVVCPICAARLHPPLRRETYRVQCPDCHEPVRVPSPQEAAALETRVKTQPPKLEEMESTGGLVLPPPVRRRPTQTFYSQQTVQIRREAPDPPPEWVWFSGVWTFPWQPGVLKKWGFISLGITLLGGLLTLLASLSGGVSSPASAVMAFFALPMIWIGIWTASYASSACLHVITETSAGNQRINDWPDQGWRDGMFSFLSMLYLVSVAALIGHVAGLAGGAAGWGYWLTNAETVRLLFPFLVLSMLETGAWYFPFSVPLAGSFGRNFMDWLVAYLLLAVLLRGWGWLWLRGAVAAPYLMPLATGWIWAAVILIAARILGRLGWRITQRMPVPPDAESPSDE
jgi:hypothetical protein